MAVRLLCLSVHYCISQYHSSKDIVSELAKAGLRLRFAAHSCEVQHSAKRLSCCQGDDEQAHNKDDNNNIS
jgi:hypothetical protein